MDFDKLALLSHDRAANATFALVDANQQRPAEEQVAASACLFLIVCEQYGVHPGTAMAVAENLIKHDRRHRPEFRAARDFFARDVVL